MEYYRYLEIGERITFGLDSMYCLLPSGVNGWCYVGREWDGEIVSDQHSPVKRKIREGYNHELAKHADIEFLKQYGDE